MADFTRRLETSRSEPDDLIRKLVDALNICFEREVDLARWDDRGSPDIMQQIQVAISDAEQYLSRART